MPTVLEELSARFESAKKRHADAQGAFQKAQAELQSATGELNIWGAAVGIEIREIENHKAQLQAVQPALPLGEESMDAQSPQTHPSPSSDAYAPSESVNKTELVRDTIRKSPGGMTANDVWKATKEIVRNRAYLYSILKRLRDRDEVVLRRKKYMVKPMEVSAGSAATLVQ